MTKRVYCAGPMSGYPEYNFPAFFAKEKELIAAGFEVVNPASLNVVPEGVTVVAGDKYWKEFMKEDIRQLIECDKIYMLKGWRSSKGASLEFTIAWALGLEVEYEDNNERVDHQRIEREARTA